MLIVVRLEFQVPREFRMNIVRSITEDSDFYSESGLRLQHMA